MDLIKVETIRICFTGGATGGHFFPLIFIKKEMDKLADEKGYKFEYYYIGVKPFDENLMKKEGIKVYKIPSSKLRKYFSFENFLDIFKFFFNLISAFYYLLKFMPDVLFSKGGPGSLGVVISAWILRIPVIIHESDSYPGLTNRLSSFFAKKIAISFKKAENYFPKNKTVLTGHPINIDFLKEPITVKDYQRFSLDYQKKVILVLGGSQGSEFLNNLILDSLSDLLEFGQVVHQTGEKHYKDVYFVAEGKLLSKVKKEKIKDYHPFPFIPSDEILNLIKISDLIISRAGAGTIFEISAVGKPSILIPIEEKVAGKHQLENAYEYSKYGSCFVLEEKNAKPHLLVSLVKEIFEKPELIETMQKGALEFSKPDAGEKLAKLILEEIEK